MRKFRIARLFAATLNIIGMFLLVTAAYSDSVSPDISVIFAYLGLLFPFLLAFNLLFLLYWILVREWMYLFGVVCALLICWKPISGYFPFHPWKETIPKENVIKLLTYNVMAFNYQPHTERKPNPIIRYIQDSGADIVCMQEYMSSASDKYLSHQSIARALNVYPYNYYLPLIDYRNYSVGLAVYSKFPIVRSWKVRYDSAFNGSTVHEINVKGKKLTIVNNHLESFKLTMEDRSKYADFIRNINSDTFDELRETVQRKLGAAFLIRSEQADIISDEVRKLKSDYIIVCGDFNDTPISYAYRTIRGSLVDAFVTSGCGTGITYNQNYFWFRIDHILHSPNMKSYHTTVEKTTGSDHYPMWCYLEMK
ncbi:MAG: endonuclease/exonuclease/phosphatase family protein [Tannerella sp.]|jgi:endonuclease/exonuclease/phosphatase family metal-dependent hydrolase|nr:endonuclease/exonuclease/phosphatase family protein [Tannerella sp.]